MNYEKNIEKPTNLEKNDNLTGTGKESFPCTERGKKDEMAGLPGQTPCNFRQEITLLDGKGVVLRPIRSDDRDALLSFHSRLSEESLFLRYLYHKGQLTESDLKIFCDVDYYNTLALVAEIERNGKKEIIGVGRFFRLPDPDSAEVAFMVEDNEQRKGLGTQLLKHLAILASERNIRYFVAELSRMNGKMISIFKKSDPGLSQVADGHTTCTITLSVEESKHNIP